MKSARKKLCATILLLAGFTALAWGLFPLLLTPRVFTRIKVEMDTTSMSGRKILAHAFDVGSEIEIIRSESVLSKVVRDLSLEQQWQRANAGKALVPGEALTQLRERVTVRQVRKTSLVDISVAGDNPDEAATIADAIADAYRSYRHEQPREAVSESVSGSVNAMQDQLNRLGEEIYGTRVKMAQLRRDAEISDADPPGVISNPEKLKAYEALEKKLGELDLERRNLEEEFTGKPHAGKATSVVSVEILRRASSQPSHASSRHVGSMTLILAGMGLCAAGAILLIPFGKPSAPARPR